MEIIAYKMQYIADWVEESAIVCLPFEEKYFDTYKVIYNACFYEMRRALEVKPYDFYKSFEQMKDKAKDNFVLIKNKEIIGAVACYSNEIDDLIVNPDYQNQGYGKELLLWGMNHIRKQNNEPITLHVAQWNQKATTLYEKIGFEVCKVEKVH